MVWGVYCLATSRLVWNLSKSDRLVAIGMSIYPLVMIASIFINPPYSEVPDWIFRLLPFFSVWLILPRMRQSPDGRLVPLFILGAGIGMIVTFLFSLLQIMFLMDRAEAGTSNAALLGVIGILFGGIALLNIQSPRSVEQRIAILGYAAGLGCVLLSGTRSAWLVIPIHIVIFLVFSQTQLPSEFAQPGYYQLLAVGGTYHPGQRPDPPSHPGASGKSDIARTHRRRDHVAECPVRLVQRRTISNQ